MFPSCCSFCKKKKIKTVNKSDEKPTNILTNEGQQSLKKAATLKNDYVMRYAWSN